MTSYRTMSDKRNFIYGISDKPSVRHACGADAHRKPITKRSPFFWCCVGYAATELAFGQQFARFVFHARGTSTKKQCLPGMKHESSGPNAEIIGPIKLFFGPIKLFISPINSKSCGAFCRRCFNYPGHVFAQHHRPARFFCHHRERAGFLLFPKPDRLFLQFGAFVRGHTGKPLF